MAKLPRNSSRRRVGPHAWPAPAEQSAAARQHGVGAVGLPAAEREAVQHGVGRGGVDAHDVVAVAADDVGGGGGDAVRVDHVVAADVAGQHAAMHRRIALIASALGTGEAAVHGDAGTDRERRRAIGAGRRPVRALRHPDLAAGRIGERRRQVGRLRPAAAVVAARAADGDAADGRLRVPEGTAGQAQRAQPQRCGNRSLRSRDPHWTSPRVFVRVLRQGERTRRAFQQHDGCVLRIDRAADDEPRTRGDARPRAGVLAAGAIRAEQAHEVRTTESQALHLDPAGRRAQRAHDGDAVAAGGRPRDRHALQRRQRLDRLRAVGIGHVEAVAEDHQRVGVGARKARGQVHRERGLVFGAAGQHRHADDPGHAAVGRQVRRVGEAAGAGAAAQARAAEALPLHVRHVEGGTERADERHAVGGDVAAVAERDEVVAHLSVARELVAVVDVQMQLRLQRRAARVDVGDVGALHRAGGVGQRAQLARRLRLHGDDVTGAVDQPRQERVGAVGGHGPVAAAVELQDQAAAGEPAHRAADRVADRCAAVDDHVVDVDGAHRAAAVDDDAGLRRRLRLGGDRDRVRRARRERRSEGEAAVGGRSAGFRRCRRATARGRRRAGRRRCRRRGAAVSRLPR